MNQIDCQTCPQAELCQIRKSRPPESINVAEPGTRLLSFRKKDPRALTDLLMDNVVVVRSGAFKVTTPTGDIVFLAGEGSLYGFQTLFLSKKVETMARPLMPEIEVCLRPWSTFQSLMFERRTLTTFVLQDMASNAWTARISFHWTKKSLRDRAIFLLDLLRNRFGVRYGQFRMINLPLTKIDIASLMSTVQESAVRVLSELRENGLISQNGKRIIILDNDRLDQMLLEIYRRDQPNATLQTETEQQKVIL